MVLFEGGTIGCTTKTISVQFMQFTWLAHGLTVANSSHGSFNPLPKLDAGVTQQGQVSRPAEF